MAEDGAQMNDSSAETMDGTDRGKSGTRRKLVMLSFPLILLIAAALYWWSLQGKVSTDNAYVKLDKVSIAPEVAGTLVAVFVSENDQVTKGQLLFRIDPDPFKVQKARAEAALASAQADLIALEADATFSGADIGTARQDIAIARTRLERQRALWERGFTTRADYDEAQHALAVAQESLRLAEAEQRAARAKLATGAAVPGENPRVAAARAELEKAELDLRRTEVHAPLAGRVGEADRLHLGQLMISGLPVLTIVAADSAYVEANFKETQLQDMQVGQPAKIRLDAWPKLDIRGTVASIGSGTGSEFSVLPAQNATGNWVKVTQRVPVRIALEGKAPREMIAGLSAHVTVFTDGRNSSGGQEN